MNNEMWSQKPLIEELSETTEFCILDEATPKNKRINAKTLLDTKANIIDLNTALDLKAPKENAEFTGTMTLNGNPVATNDLNGTNYVMVYGIGTPAENAAELQAAYNEAKKMPRFLGFLNPTTPEYMYAGQTFGVYLGGILTCYKVLVDGQYTPYQMSGPITVTPEEAKSTRTKVIVAPGEYDFGDSAFVADACGIDIVSLTGNSDVIISSTEGSLNYGYYYGIKVTVNNVLLKGIDCKTNDFYIANDLNNLICEYCTGGRSSFGAGGVTVSGTFNNCTGGGGSFGAGGGTLTGTFNCCIGGEDSFGSDGGTITGTLTNCKLTSGAFPIPSGGGKIYNCIDGSGNLVNYPITHTATSKRLILSVTQTGVNAPTYTVLHNDFGPISHATYIGVGMYRIFFVSNELTNLSKSFIKQNMTLLQSDGGGVSYYIMGGLTANYINLDTVINHSRTDELLDNTIIEVEMITT